MNVLVEAIELNHDSASATTDALNIRRNAAQFVDVPEWIRGVSILPEDSLVAYAIAETRGNVITIRAKFRRADPSVMTAEIRAVDPANPRAQGCIYALLRLLGITPTLPPPYGNCLGEVSARSVSFSSGGETAFEPFELTPTWPLSQYGVGAHTVTWQWQYRLSPSDPWTDMDVTRHRVYLITHVPTAPWEQTPYSASNTQLPWTEALEYACLWAHKASSRDDAACKITRALYDLGAATVEYDCPGGGSHHYAYPLWDPTHFDCTAFLELLGGGVGNGRYVNCTDCATIVSTFANLVGCDLWQSRMASGFALNPILAIGSSSWEPACASSGWSGSFNYHEVAWKGECTAADEVFDACLKVDADADPTAAPHTPLLVCSMPFGDTGDGTYRDHLATPAGRPNCNPQPSTRNRKIVT